MKVTTLPGQMNFEGVLDERSDFALVEQSFSKLKSENQGKPITVDFSKVTRGNSSGIMKWLQFLDKVKYCFRYVGAPVWLVNQFNAISGYFAGGSYPYSIQAPFFCEATETSMDFTLILGKDLEIRSDYTGFQIPDVVVDGQEFQIDFEPEYYFQFITANYEYFKKMASQPSSVEPVVTN